MTANFLTIPDSLLHKTRAALLRLLRNFVWPQQCFTLHVSYMMPYLAQSTCAVRPTTGTSLTAKHDATSAMLRRFVALDTRQDHRAGVLALLDSCSLRTFFASYSTILPECKFCPLFCLVLAREQDGVNRVASQTCPLRFDMTYPEYEFFLWLFHIWRDRRL